MDRRITPCWRIRHSGFNLGRIMRKKGRTMKIISLLIAGVGRAIGVGLITLKIEPASTL